MISYSVGQTVKTRKTHVCGSNEWEVLRVGADYKLKCLNCGRIVMLDSDKFHKAVINVGTTK